MNIMTKKQVNSKTKQNKKQNKKYSNNKKKSSVLSKVSERIINYLKEDAIEEEKK